LEDDQIIIFVYIVAAWWKSCPFYRKGYCFPIQKIFCPTEWFRCSFKLPLFPLFSAVCLFRRWFSIRSNVPIYWWRAWI